MRRNVRVGSVVAVLVVLLVVFLARHAVARALISTLVSVATGYRVEIDETRIGLNHGAAIGVHVSRHGESLLDAARVDIYYHLRDLLPGSARRFGLVGITIDHPQLTIVHHQDGTYNFKSGGGGGGAVGAPPGGPVVPLNFFARVRGGEAQVIDDYQYYKEARLQRVRGIDADISVNTQTRTHYVVSGAIADIKDQPFRAVGTVDYTRGYAMHRVRAAALPVKAIGNYVINSPAAHILAGTARDFHATVYALGIAPNVPFTYHVNAGATLNDAQFYVRGLAKPIDRIHGAIQIFDGGLAAQRLDATIGGIPVVVAGGIYDFSAPKFRLGVSGRGKLEQLRTILAFSRTQPVRGDVNVRTLIEGPIGSPLLLVGIDGNRAYYNTLPLDRPRGVIALYNGVVSIVPLHATYSGIDVRVHGRLKLGDRVDTELAASYAAPSSVVPYLGAIVPYRNISGTALITGLDTKIAARGYIAAENQYVASAFYSFDPRGVGTVGPFALAAANGGTAFGGYSIDRPHRNSAFWVSANDLPVHQPKTINFSGLQLPPLPQIDGKIVDAGVIGEGSGGHVLVAGRALATNATIASVDFRNIGASFAGTLSNAAVNSLHADGAWGRFDGNGSFAPNALAARGTYSGTLEGLRPFTGDIAGHGALSGPMAIALTNGRVVVQAQNAQLRSATVHGVPIRSVSGTVAYQNGRLQVYSAQAQAASGSVVAAGALGTGQRVALATTTLDAAQLRGIGLPVQRGSVLAFGTVSPTAPLPAFDGGVVVKNGNAQGYRIDATADVHLAGTAVDLRNTVANIGGTVGIADGRVASLTSKQPAYDVHAFVPAGSVALAASTLHLPAFGTEGSFLADVHVGGEGLTPTVNGRLDIPVGSINGLGFERATSMIDATHTGVNARGGSVLVGQTWTSFSATMNNGERALHIRAPRADLADFNDYFDTGDTLAGHGLIDLSMAQNARAVSTSGDIDVFGLRYRSLPIGDTDAQWFSARNVVTGSVRVGGEHGTLQARGTVSVAPSLAIDKMFARSSYNINAQLSQLDLSTWLPAFGFPTVPLTGRVDGESRLVGRYPHLAIGGTAKVENGTIGPLPIERAAITARAAGSRIEITDATAQLPALNVEAKGSFGLAPTDALRLQVHAQTNQLTQLIALLSKKSVDVSGNFESTVSLGGTLSRPTYDAGFYATGVHAYGINASSIVGGLSLAQRNVRVSNLEINFLSGSVTLAGSLPLQLSPFRVGPPQAPIALDFTADKLDLSQFASFLGNNTKLAGQLDGRVALAGRVDQPAIYGGLTLQNGSYVSALETQPVTNTDLKLSFAGTRASIDRFHANPGRGSVDGSGVAAFEGSLSRGDLSFDTRLSARGAQLAFPTYGSGTLDANLALSRAPRQLALLRGDVTASDAVIPFAAFMRAQQPGSTGPSTAAGMNLAFNLGISAGRNVRVRGGGIGAGLDISGTGHAQLAGTLAQPTLAGRFDSTGGTLTYVDHAFRVQSGFVAFTPENGVLPDVHAVGVTHVINPDPNTARNPNGTADIIIKVDGPINAPTIAFSSDPPGYTKEQIIALLLPFGGLVGSIQFTDQGAILPPGQLRGAPTAGTGAPLPGVFVRRENGQLTISQEAFNILNAQFTQGLLSPLESVLGSALGFSDVNLTIDYTGNFGVNFRRSLARNFYAVYATTLGVPIRQTFGVQYQPTQYTVVQVSVFEQQGPVQVFLAPSHTISTNARATAGQAVTGSNGFTFTIQRLF